VLKTNRFVSLKLRPSAESYPISPLDSQRFLHVKVGPMLEYGHCSGHDRAKRIHLLVPTLGSSTYSVPSAVNCEAEKDFVTSSRYMIRSLGAITDQVGNIPAGMCDGFGGLEQRCDGDRDDPDSVTLRWMLEYNTMLQVKQ
jgi:hypothetical protein